MVLWLTVNFSEILHAESNATGFGDSNGFSLNTENIIKSGVADSGSFILDTGGDDGTLGSGHGDSSGFTLDTSAGGDGVSSINLEQTGASESGTFVLDTSDGNVSGDVITSGFADSGGFLLDTNDLDPFHGTGYGESAGFVLDTGANNGEIKSGVSDSSGFILDTLDSASQGDNHLEFGFKDSTGFILDTTDGNSSQDNQGGSDQNESFAMVSVSGTVTYDGVIPGPAYVYQNTKNAGKREGKN